MGQKSHLLRWERRCGQKTCAASFSVLAAQKGYRTLIVSTDPAHSLADIFKADIKEQGQLAPNLWGYEINPQQESARYIERIKAQLRVCSSPIIMEEIERQVEAAYSAPVPRKRLSSTSLLTYWNASTLNLT